MLGPEEMLALSVSPLRDNVRVLAKEEHILNCPGLARGHNTLLQRVSLRVADQAQIDGEPIFRHSSMLFLMRSMLRPYRHVRRRGSANLSHWQTRRPSLPTLSDEHGS